MRLYHGSNTEIAVPRIEMSRRNLDFGPGFYCTSHQEQAERWARRRALRMGSTPVVNVYEFDEQAPLELRSFPENNQEWVEFVCECRRGGARPGMQDLVVGGVADDQVFRAVDMYYRGLWDLPTTLRALEFYERSDQFCFCSQWGIERALRFEFSYEVR